MILKKINLELENKKLKTTNKKLSNKIKELEANMEFLFDENQVLKAKLRKRQIK